MELLLEDLAEHILLELTPCVPQLQERWLGPMEAYVKESVILLMEAAGETVDDESKRSMSLKALLQRFLTGTEKTKSWGKRSHSHSTPMEKGPIYTLSFESPAKKAKDLKDKNKIIRLAKQIGQPITPNGIPEADNYGAPSNATTAPNYLHSSMFMDSAGIDKSY